MFESFETSAIIGVIFFVFSFLYFLKMNNDKAILGKIIIGFMGILYAAYIPLRTIYLVVEHSIDIESGFSQWIDSSLITLNNLFSGNLIIIWFALICLVIAIFYKKQFDWRNIIFCIIPIILLNILLLYFKTKFIPNPKVELHNYSLALWFIYPVFLFVIFLDYFRIDISKYNKFLFHNLIIVASIFGIMNLSWQIHSFYEFGKYEAYLKNLISKSPNVVLKIPRADLNKYTFLNNNMCFGTMVQAIFLTKEGQKSKIIFPSKYFCDYSKYCFDDSKHTYYDKSKNILYIQTAPYRIKTKYWDLSNIVSVFKKQGRIKNM